jgi:mono/diheme cytochrome c family protein
MSAERSMGALVLALALGLVATGCKDPDRYKKEFTEPYKLAGGKTLDPVTLNHGFEAFMLYCYGCHGEKGDGKGPAALGMRPPPRNFQQGIFKFGGVAAGSLPVDEALDRTIRRGLHGTPMLPWDVPEVERKYIIAYLKTFTTKWQEEEPGAPIEISPDPWKGKEQEAIARGKEVYHVAGEGHAGCAACHASYAPRQEISDMMKAVTGSPAEDFAEEMYRTSLRETEYALEMNEKGESTKVHQQLPPDFLYHKVKTAYPVGSTVDGKVYTAEMQREDLYRTMGAGVNGAAMPTWKGNLPEENLWALTYYIQSLVELRGKPEAFALREKLEAQPKWAPPAPAPEAPKDGKAPEPAPKGGGSR